VSQVKVNIIANLAGSGWVALISIAFIPLYLHFMGVEPYGLVGFYFTLQALFAVLDMGLTATVSRELARLSSSSETAQEMRDLVRTLEIIYWVIALFILSVIILLAPWIATKWLNASTLSDETIRCSLILMGLMIAFRMPYGFYSGALLGLQRQVLLNAIKIIVETVKSGGVIFVLWLVSPSIISFFIWQVAISGLGLFLIAVVLWKQMPVATVARFQFGILKSIWRFTVGMSGITITGAILTQSDKLMLSKILSLEAFAYYILSSTVAMGLYVIISPVFSAVYPKFSQLIANNDECALIVLYHKSCQLMTVIVMPVALIMCFYSENLFQIWTQDTTVSHHAAPILSLLIIGTALNGMMNIPYALQLAYGRPKLIVYINVIAIIVLLPPLMWAASVYGALGGAMIWLALNVGYIVFGVIAVHRKALQSELFFWITNDFGLPSIIALSVVMLSWLILPEGMGDGGYIIWIILSYLISLMATLYAASEMRVLLFNLWRKGL
jgi:O-antigen/teichoic acid export membrane protein